MVSPLMTDSAGPPAPSPLGDQPPPCPGCGRHHDPANAWDIPTGVLLSELLADETAAAELDPPVK